MSPNEKMENNDLKQDITNILFTYNPKSNKAKFIRIDGYPVNINIYKNIHLPTL